MRDALRMNCMHVLLCRGDEWQFPCYFIQIMIDELSSSSRALSREKYPAFRCLALLFGGRGGNRLAKNV